MNMLTRTRVLTVCVGDKVIMRMSDVLPGPTPLNTSSLRWFAQNISLHTMVTLFSSGSVILEPLGNAKWKTANLYWFCLDEREYPREYTGVNFNEKFSKKLF